jgi:hypothetical protein
MSASLSSSIIASIIAVSGRKRQVISSLLRLIIEKKMSKTSPIPGNLLLFNLVFDSASVMIVTFAAVMQIRHHPQAQYLTPQIATTFPLLLDSDRTWRSNRPCDRRLLKLFPLFPSYLFYLYCISNPPPNPAAEEAAILPTTTPLLLHRRRHRRRQRQRQHLCRCGG